ncbi:MAG: hypothetical protein IKT96_03445, partial [Paludibacteraceae bacterium]|nr:hypothetical protein [Paludibacteraceae bacterium]
LRWSTENGEFSMLRLIDHIAGVTVDCLTQDEYHFQGKQSDFASRFRLEFDCTGIEEEGGTDNA